MAITNFLVTLMGVGAVAFLMKSDVRKSSAMLRRNLRTIRGWLEEQGAAAEQEIKQVAEGVKKPEPPKPDAPKP